MRYSERVLTGQEGTSMRTIQAMAVSVAAIATSAYAGPQAADLPTQLHSTYVETMMDASGLKVAKAGSTLVVQIEGVMANPNKNKAVPYLNTFSDGQIKPDTSGGLVNVVRNPFSKLKASSAERALSVGEKVYLLKVELNPDNVALTVQSCGECDPKAVDPAHQPFRAKVTFKFLHGALASTDLKHVRQTIDQVFKFPDADGNATGSNATGGAGGNAPAAPPAEAPQQAQAPPTPPAQEAPPQQYAPIAPPPAPPAAPRQIKLGMTLQEVKDGFGEPISIVDLGSKVIYKYKDLKVTFINGKVSDVE
jgi:hypothetical protein